MSFAWMQYAGKYAEPFVQMYADVPNAARFAATALNRRTKGRRVIFFQNAEQNGSLFLHPDDRIGGGSSRGLWFTNGIAATRASFGVVIEQLYANKGDLDFAVFDVESATSGYTFSPAGFEAIYADPRYRTLVATGTFPADCRNMSEADSNLFNYGCALLCDRAFKAALIAPLYKRYNHLSWSNFADSPVTKADAPLAPDFNGHANYYAPSSATHYAPVMYNYVGQLALQDARFKTPIFALAWECNCFKAIYRAKADAKITPWLAPRVLSNVMDPPHWIETIYHACCLTGTNLLYFNANDPSALTNWKFDTALATFIGQCRGKVWKNVLTTDLSRFDTVKFVHSACKLADGSVVGRVTFAPGIDTATVTVLGKTYTVKRPAGGVGEWFHS